MPRIARLSPAAVGNGLTAAGRQLKAWWSTGRDDAKTPPGLYGKLSLFTFSVFCLNALALLYFHIAANYDRFYVGGRQEDTLVELLTVPLFAASSLALFLVAVAVGRGWLRRFYILVGLGALFVAGEELSWGQHILYRSSASPSPSPIARGLPFILPLRSPCSGIPASAEIVNRPRPLSPDLGGKVGNR